MNCSGASVSRGRDIRVWHAVMVVALFTGCVQRTDSGQETTFSYALWLPTAIIVATVVAIPLTWILRKRLGIGGWAYLLMGVWLLIAVCAVPTYLNSYTMVSDERLQNRSGLWGQARVLDVQYGDIKSVQVDTSVRGATQRTRAERDVAEIQLKSGGIERFYAYWDVEVAALDLFIERAKRRGVRVQDARGR